MNVQGSRFRRSRRITHLENCQICGKLIQSVELKVLEVQGKKKRVCERCHDNFNIKTEYRCYTCTSPCILEEIKTVDKQFEETEAEVYVFLVDFLGLHHCDGPSNLFHGNNTNTCNNCYNRALEAFRGYKKEDKKVGISKNE